MFAVRSSCVCVFIRLFVSLCFSLFLWLVGFLLGCLCPYGSFCFLFDLGAPSVVFVVIWVSFICVFSHLWGPWGSIVAPGAPLWDPWGTCCRFSTLLVALGLNFETLGLHLAPLGPFCCLFKTLGRDPGPMWRLLRKSHEKGPQKDRKREPKYMPFR